MFLSALTLENILSFGQEKVSLDLTPLTVLIGPNGSGKSNFIDVVSVLRAAPTSIALPIRKGGGLQEWTFKSAHPLFNPQIEARIIYHHQTDDEQEIHNLVYSVELGRMRSDVDVLSEKLSMVSSNNEKHSPIILMEREAHSSEVDIRNSRGETSTISLPNNNAIFQQIKDPVQYPEITNFGEYLTSFKLYRDWNFGRTHGQRLPQPTDLRNDYLDEEGNNLGLILNRVRRDSGAKRKFLDNLCILYEGINDFDVIVEAGSVQIFLEEENRIIPATRLSDGTLRYLSLLAVLCHPSPPPLVCIEEPELGLHPDILPSLARLLQEASKCMQIIVATHSDILVDALTDTPECVVVCEKHDGATRMTRLNADKLKEWLEKYSLGQLWRMGEIGGTRW